MRNKEKLMSKPRILIYDIETMATLAYVWTQYDANIISTHTDWHLLSFAYKWAGEKQIRFHAIWDEESWKPGSTDDEALTQRLRDLFDEADIVVAYNGDGFDQKKTNARMLFHRIDPPSPYRTIDPLKVMRANFKNYSNSLKETARLLSLEHKLEVGGFGTWLGCMAGDKVAQARMKKYNRGDITVLDELYVLLTPWIKKINMGMFNVNLEDPSCARCGSKNVMRRGFQLSNVYRYQRWHCGDCGGWSRSRMAEREVTRIQTV